jgi:hypothetical protein
MPFTIGEIIDFVGWIVSTSSPVPTLPTEQQVQIPLETVHIVSQYKKQFENEEIGHVVYGPVGTKTDIPSYHYCLEQVDGTDTDVEFCLYKFDPDAYQTEIVEHFFDSVDPQERN